MIHFLKSTFGTDKQILALFAAIIIVCFGLSIATELYLIAVIPFLCIGVFIAIYDFKILFYFLIICIPLSSEQQIGNSLVDFPSDFFIVGLMAIYFVYVLLNWKKMDVGFVKHPITLLLIIHLIWIVFVTIQSDKFIVSFKFLLAKIWYVTTFFFLAGTIFKDTNRVKVFFYCCFFPLLFIVIQSIVRHATYGFTFKDINKALSPFYRNHVTYACIIALVFPYLLLARQWFKIDKWKRYFIDFCIILFLIAIQLSYTRTAYATILIAGLYYLVIRWRMTKVMILSIIIFTSTLVGYMSYRNNYLNFAPDYNKTIVHKNFDNLIQATFQMKDISTMERVYRWIAGFRMVQAHPYTGFGPGNFYTFYKNYTVNDFKTYVSDNPEQSGIHCYYLMLGVEQGVIGTLLFFLLVFYVLYKGEQLYYQMIDKSDRSMLLATLSSYIIILGLLMINDMIETDKVGSFFFINMAIIINLDLQNKRKIKKLYS
jgi:O-antigen ligase